MFIYFKFTLKGTAVVLVGRRHLRIMAVVQSVAVQWPKSLELGLMLGRESS